MISVYNETKNAWCIEDMNASVIRFAKTKEKKTGETSVKKRTISIISYTPLFKKMEDLKSTLLAARLTKKPVKLTDKSTAVVFNNKEFKPFINERTYNLKNILLGSLFLQGKKIINVRNDHTFLLEFFMLSAEFSFIASFNNPNARLTIDLLDEKTNKISCYKFSQKDGEIDVEVTTRNATKEEINSTFRIRIFRPSRPTNVVLVYPKDREELKKVLDETKHTIVEYTSIDNEIANLISSNYKAVTIFVKTKFRNETDVEKERYGKAIDKLNKQFQTVFKLHVDGKIDKLKY